VNNDQPATARTAAIYTAATHVAATHTAATRAAATHIAVIDNGICNLRSVTKALETVGATTHVIRAPAEIPPVATGLVLPGVGALRDCVASLCATGLAGTVRAWIAADTPFLGVCLGMQALFDYSEEGDTRGLGIFPGKVVRFNRPPEYKIPHMGWNPVRFTQPAPPLVAGLRAEGESFYFVHSYHCVPDDPALVLATCDYGGPFTAAIARGNCYATQFHPEKSQSCGLQIYRNFVSIAASSPAPLPASPPLRFKSI
jgi:glutamine amidotransferase